MNNLLGLRYFNKKDTSKIGYLDKDLKTIIDYKAYEVIGEKNNDWVSLNPHGKLRLIKLISDRTNIIIKDVKPIEYVDLCILYKNKLKESLYKIDYAYRYNIHTHIGIANHKEYLSTILEHSAYDSKDTEIKDIAIYVDTTLEFMNKIFPYDKDKFSIKDPVDDVIKTAMSSIREIFDITIIDCSLKDISDDELKRDNLFRYNMYINLNKIQREYNLIIDSNENIFIKVL